MLNDWIARVRSFFTRPGAEQQLDDELRFHLDRLVERYIATGIDPSEAVRRAQIEFGGLEQIKEECRDGRPTRLAADVGQDLRYSVRLLTKERGLAAVAILTLALGVGVNTAMFSVINAVLLHPYPYDHADRLVALSERGPEGEQPIVWPDFEDWQRLATSFDAVAAWRSLGGISPVVTLGGRDQPEQVRAVAMTASMFRVLGVPPLAGRVFGESDDRAGAEPVVVLGYGLWQRRFGGDPAAIGETISVDGRPYTIIGLMPPSFRFQWTDLWAPLVPTLDPSERTSRVVRMGIFGLGRIRGDKSLADARRELDGIARTLQQAYPDSNGAVTASVVSLAEAHATGYRTALFILFAAVILVLIIACANVATLLLSRAAVRAPELALRAALGANRRRLISQALTEALPLAAAGSAAGLGLAWEGVRALPTVIPGDAIPAESHLRIDSTVLAFTLAIAVGTLLLCAILPAIVTARTDAATLLSTSRSTPASAGTMRTRSLLVFGEIALALTLLVSAGLLVQSLQRLRAVDPGFEPSHVLELRLTLPEHRYPTSARNHAFYDDVLTHIRRLPGVDSAAAATGLPLAPSSTELGVVMPDRTYTRLEDLDGARYTLVTPEYFAAMGIPLRAGRSFTHLDRREAPAVAIVNEALVRRFFGGQNPIGHHVQFGVPDNLIRPGMFPAGVRFQWSTVVGIAADARNNGISRPPVPEAYIPFGQGLDLRMVTASAAIVIRTSGDPAQLAEAVRAEIHSADLEQPIQALRPMEAAIGSTLEQPRFSALLLSLFAAIAVVLATVGIYGIVSHAVAQRTGEIGIRMALGASRESIRRLVLRQSVGVAGSGIAVGTLGAAAATRVLRGALFGITPGDPLTFAAAAIGLLVIVVIASWVPARRATRLDPLTALKHE